jgi:hypothetical protein
MSARSVRRFVSVIAVLAAIGAVTAYAAVAAPVARQAPIVLPGSVFAIDAVTSSDAWAIGTQQGGGGYHEARGLAEHWNGHTWKEFPTPGFDQLSGGLVDVSLSSSDEGFAVGSKGIRGFRDKQVVVEHWNGTSWTLSKAPDKSFNDVLSGVSSVSKDDAWAVGAYSTGGTGRGHMLIEHWNGTSWKIVAPPDIESAELNAVEAISSDDVWAVGFVGGQTLTLHFDGNDWTRVASPNRGSAPNELVDVAASGPNDVWAVGVADAGHPFPGKTVVLHWTGDAWHMVASASPKSGDQVGGVAVTSPGSAWLGGAYWPNPYHPRGLVEHFTQGASALVPVPGHASFNKLSGVADDDLWAAGGGIYHWNGARWTKVAVPTA